MSASAVPPKRWTVLQHVAHEGPGLVADVLAARGHEMSVVRIDQGDRVPDVEAVASMAGLVVMGGPMGVDQDDSHPWLAAERRLLAAAVDADLAVLGICLGAQQLAAALGAVVDAGPEPEIGPGEVHLTRQAEEDPVFGACGAALACFHWHGDTFFLPDGAVLLAWNELYLHQAFRFGARAYGLQFHVEINAALAQGWRPHLGNGLIVSDLDVARIARSGRSIIERFVDLADDDPAEPIGGRARGGF